MKKDRSKFVLVLFLKYNQEFCLGLAKTLYLSITKMSYQKGNQIYESGTLGRYKINSRKVSQTTKNMSFHGMMAAKAKQIKNKQHQNLIYKSLLSRIINSKSYYNLF